MSPSHPQLGRPPELGQPAVAARRAPGESAAKPPARAPAGGPASEGPASPDDVTARVALTPISELPGAGPATTARLREAGIETVGDLLFSAPRGYDDLRSVTPLAALAGAPDGAMVLVRGRVARVSVFPRRFLAVHLTDDSGATVVARWFRVPGGMARGYEKGTEVALAGPLRRAPSGGPELLHPANVTAALLAGPRGDEPVVGLGIRPRYALVAGVAGRVVERMAGAAVDRFAARLPDVFPVEARERMRMPSLAEALLLLHRPPRDASHETLAALSSNSSDAHRRLAAEDLLIVQVGLARRRAAARAQPAPACDANAGEVRARVDAALPFALTAAQRRAIVEIQHDLAAARPMQRLLVGDVGSGKTAVAFAAAAQAALSGGQTLLMAPTEVLAEQHLRTLAPLCERLGLRAALLTASTPRPRRETLLALARAGRIALLVGTQALLADRVALGDLRLAIVDEQHRFGVAQRARLRQRDGADTGLVPHLLVMTATPIPRTLAFTLYGDLDISLLDELPPGRQVVRTRILEGRAGRRAAESALRAAVAAGGRAFVVCPVREVSAREGGVTAIDRHRELVPALHPARVGLVHGAMDVRAKDAALRAFATGALDVLVATTVVEVGIDVPQASLMVVEEADRFGLAQLHQLRGRVGRGTGAAGADCLLLIGGGREAGGRESGAEAGQAARRLSVLAATTDGFRIAEADLEQRGWGDLFGVRQAGMPRLRFTDLAGTAWLLAQVRDEASRILDVDPDLARPEHACLREALELRWRAASVFAEEAG